MKVRDAWGTTLYTPKFGYSARITILRIRASSLG